MHISSAEALQTVAHQAVNANRLQSAYLPKKATCKGLMMPGKATHRVQCVLGSGSDGDCPDTCHIYKYIIVYYNVKMLTCQYLTTSILAFASSKTLRGTGWPRPSILHPPVSLDFAGAYQTFSACESISRSEIDQPQLVLDLMAVPPTHPVPFPIHLCLELIVSCYTCKQMEKLPFIPLSFVPQLSDSLCEYPLQQSQWPAPPHRPMHVQCNQAWNMGATLMMLVSIIRV